MLPGFLAGELVVADDVLEVDVSGDQVPGGDEVVVVDDLNEWLNLASPFDFLCAHSIGHFQGVPLDAGHQSVGELLVLQSG